MRRGGGRRGSSGSRCRACGPGGRRHKRGRTCRIPADTRRSAHKSSVVIYYRWHPLCGRELDVCGRHVRGGESSYVVVLPDGTRTEIPEWMTRADAGSGSSIGLVSTHGVHCRTASPQASP